LQTESSTLGRVTECERVRALPLVPGNYSQIIASIPAADRQSLAEASSPRWLSRELCGPGQKRDPSSHERRHNVALGTFIHPQSRMASRGPAEALGLSLQERLMKAAGYRQGVSGNSNMRMADRQRPRVIDDGRGRADVSCLNGSAHIPGRDSGRSPSLISPVVVNTLHSDKFSPIGKHSAQDGSPGGEHIRDRR